MAKSIPKGFAGVMAGAMRVCCHMELEVTAWLEPSSMTSLIALWLAGVLIADGDEPSPTAFSLPVKSSWCWKPFIHSKFSSMVWPLVMSGKTCW